jgi:CRP-like cAMP-binding protein
VRALCPSRLHPVNGLLVTEPAERRARRTLRLAQDLAWLDATQRMERTLEDLGRRFGRPVPGGTLIALPLTQEHLAALTGTSRETANRSLRRLLAGERLGVAARGRYVLRPGLHIVEG